MRFDDARLARVGTKVLRFVNLGSEISFRDAFTCKSNDPRDTSRCIALTIQKPKSGVIRFNNISRFFYSKRW